MTETDLDTPRLWVEFADPDEWDPETEHPHTVVKADLTWLTSSWSCIFGRGCPGIDKEAPEVGCCRLGAHFSEEDDLLRVEKYVTQLTPQTWQRHPGRTVERADWVGEDTDGEPKTKVAEKGCVLANDPDFPGGSGCALHHLADSLGVPFVETKPDVCWQLPIRRTYRTVERPDGTEYLEVSIAEYDRRGWGEGGHDLDWYCTGSPQAYIGTLPVFISLRDELVELIGQPAYDVLAGHCEDVHGMGKLIPLAIHPAQSMADEQRRP